MDKKYAIGIRHERTIAAVAKYINLKNGEELRWKQDSGMLLLRFLLFLDHLYKWTVLSCVNLNANNCWELKKELAFFEKFCDMHEKFCAKSNRPSEIHYTTKKIILYTCRSLLELVERETFRVYPYRLSTSQ